MPLGSCPRKAPPVLKHTLPAPALLALVVVLLASWVLPQGAHARTATVSADYGYDAADATRFVQAALDDATADTVLLDAGAGVWRTRRLLIRRSDLVFLFEPGTVLEAVPSVLDSFESLVVLAGLLTRRARRARRHHPHG